MYILIKFSLIFQFTIGFVCIIQPVSPEYWVEDKEHLNQGPWKKLVPAEFQESCGFNAGGNMKQICGGCLDFVFMLLFNFKTKKKPTQPGS